MGIIKRINIYPLKSGRGVEVSSATFDLRGLEYDRHWAIIDPTNNNKVLTQRDFPVLATLTPEITEGVLRLRINSDVIDAPIITDRSKLISIKLFSNDRVAIDQGNEVGKKLSEALDREVKLIYQPNDLEDESLALVDDSAVLIISRQSLADANEGFRENGLPDFLMNRFRPTFEVEVSSPYEEDSWDSITLGDTVQLKANEQCKRCSIPNVDQGTGIFTNTTYLKVLNNKRGVPALGMYFNNTNIGTVKVGDEIRSA